jgi:hypothetical protein
MSSFRPAGFGMHQKVNDLTTDHCWSLRKKTMSDTLNSQKKKKKKKIFRPFETYHT